MLVLWHSEELAVKNGHARGFTDFVGLLASVHSVHPSGSAMTVVQRYLASLPADRLVTLGHIKGPRGWIVSAETRKAPGCGLGYQPRGPKPASGRRCVHGAGRPKHQTTPCMPGSSSSLIAVLEHCDRRIIITLDLWCPIVQHGRTGGAAVANVLVPPALDLHPQRVPDGSSTAVDGLGYASGVGRTPCG